MNKLRNNLNRSSFLKSKIEIQELFDTGKKIYSPIFRIVYLYEFNSENYGLKLFVSAPKKLLKSAVNRNTAKRRLREAFRLNCHQLNQYAKSNKIKLRIGLIHTSFSVCEYNIIEQNLVISLQKIYSEIYGKFDQTL